MTKIWCLVVLLASPAGAVQSQRLDEAVQKADKLYREKPDQPDEAVKVLQKLVSQEPNPASYLALARIQERVGRVDDAGESLKKAVAAAASATPAERARAHAALAASYIRRGLGKDAIDEAASAVDAQSNGLSLGTLARALAHGRDPQEALKKGESAVLAEPKSAAALEGRGEALLALGRYADAVAAFDDALKVDPKMTLALVRRAQAEAHTPATVAKAVTDARAAVAAEEKYGLAFAALGQALIAADPKTNGDEAIGQAQQGATVLDPSDPEVQVVTGKILEIHDNNYEAAMKNYRSATTRDPVYWPAWEALAQVEYTLAKTDQALEDARKTLEGNPSSLVALLLVGKIQFRKEQYVETHAMLERAIALAPTAENHALLGAADQYIALSSEALAHYDAALKLDPKNLDYKTTRGLLLGLNKRYPEGIELLKEVIATPGFKGVASAYVNLGWLYRHSKPPKPGESAAAYTHALEKDPKNSQAEIGLGWAFLDSKRWDDGIAAFQKGVDDPKSKGEALDGIAWCYLMKGDLTRAGESLEKATEAGRPDPLLRKDWEELTHPKGPGIVPKPTRGPIIEERVDLSDLVNKLRTGTPAQKRLAAAELGKIRDAVPHLCYCLATEPDVEVRDVAVTSLGTLGGSEAKACLHKVVSTPPPMPDVYDTPEKRAKAVQEDKLRRHIRAVLGIPD
jgi:tetratricopeptide (TPR) repeat protein